MKRGQFTKAEVIRLERCPILDYLPPFGGKKRRSHRYRV